MAGPDQTDFFPPASSATQDGLVMVGGHLRPDWVVEAYRHGIFPWPIVDQGYEILAWFSPDPRTVIELDNLYVSRRLARRVRSGQFRVTCDRDFAAVVAGCAEPRSPFGETWITPRMASVYRQLHEQGHAHSIEVWIGNRLMGGLYGVSLGAFFAGESMFHRTRDASKVAMVYLVAHLEARNYHMLDVQQSTDHAVRMGATEVPRAEFLERLDRALKAPVSFGNELNPSQLESVIQRRAHSGQDTPSRRTLARRRGDAENDC